jgi:hypothetical protein
VARIDAARLDGAQLLGIGAEVFVDTGLTPRQRQMLIARAAVANRPDSPHEHTRCQRDAAGRCALCFKGSGPGLAASDGRWFDDATFTWRDRDGRPAAAVPPHAWRFVAVEPVAAGDAGRSQRRCASCTVRTAERARERPAAARPRRHHGGRTTVGAGRRAAGGTAGNHPGALYGAAARGRSTQIALDLAAHVAAPASGPGR